MGRVFLALVSTLFLVTQVMAGAWTSNNFLYKPAIGARGDDEKAKFDSGLNRVDSRLANEKWLNDSPYNGNLATAITAIGSAQTVISLPDGNCSISADLTVPANLTLKFARGARLTIATGKTLTINGSLEAGLHQIFSCTGSGKVVFGPGAASELRPEWWGAVADASTDCTAAINAAFTAASTPGVANKVVKLGSGGYMVGNLLFGSQSLVAQSGAPVSLIGEGFGATIIKAIAGTTGTVLKAWSTSGVTLKDFSIDGSSTATTCIDTTWKPGAGASVNNIYENVRVYGSTGIPWVMVNNNDCVMSKLISVAAAANIAAFDLRATGGGVSMSDCQWPTGFLWLGSQTATLNFCWGFGIKFAASCYLTVNLNGCYIYWNPTLKACLWSESYAASQGVIDITATDTLFEGQPVGALSGGIFDLNLGNTLQLNGCQFDTAAASTNLFGPNMTTDPARAFLKNATVIVRGGMRASNLVINEKRYLTTRYEDWNIGDTGLNTPNSAKGGGRSFFMATTIPGSAVKVCTVATNTASIASTSVYIEATCATVMGGLGATVVKGGWSIMVNAGVLTITPNAGVAFTAGVAGLALNVVPASSPVTDAVLQITQTGGTASFPLVTVDLYGGAYASEECYLKP